MIKSIKSVSKYSFITTLIVLMVLFFCGCTSTSETEDNKNEEVNFEETLAKETSDENKYESLPYIGDWFLGSINTGEKDENDQYVWESPSYLEKLKINPSGLIVDTIEDDSIEGYLIPEETQSESDNSVMNCSDTNFKARFSYEYGDNEFEEIEINLVYDQENDCLVVMYEEDIVSCIYYRGEVESINQLEDGTYVDSEGNPIDIDETNIINSTSEK